MFDKHTILRNAAVEQWNKAHKDASYDNVGTLAWNAQPVAGTNYAEWCIYNEFGSVLGYLTIPDEATHEYANYHRLRGYYTQVTKEVKA